MAFVAHYDEAFRIQCLLVNIRSVEKSSVNRCLHRQLGERFVACTTFGATASAVVGLHNILCMPNQSANRIIVPTLPGSCTPSKAKASSSVGCQGTGVGFSKTATTCCGACKSETRASSDADSSRTSAAGHCALLCRKSAVAKSSRQGSKASRSPTTFGPSAMKRPSASRCRLRVRPCSHFISALVSILWIFRQNYKDRS